MKLWRSVGIVLLVFLAPGAIWGGVDLIVHADGNPFGRMPQSLLQHSPFSSYFIPGIVLLVSNGLLGLWVLWLSILKRAHYGYWIALQGCILFGWIAMECWMLRMVVFPQILYAAIGVALILAGIALRHEPSAQNPIHG